MAGRYNIRKDIVKVLEANESLKKVSSTLPAEWREFPCAIYSTKSQPFKKDLSMNEILTKWSVNVDLYSNKSGLSDLADEIMEAFKLIGFKNESADDSNVTGLFRIQLKFTGIVDNKTLIVYQS